MWEHRQATGEGHFHYDADGNRILTVLPNGVKVYTPFPDYEETVPTTGATGDGVFYYAYSDHLGNVVAWTNASGAGVTAWPRPDKAGSRRPWY